MRHALLADAVLVLHGLFIVWVVFGGVAVIARPVLAWLHLPAVAWAVWVSWSGSYCPLTPLEQSLRRSAGQAGYEGGFIEHYLTAAIYPQGLTLDLQILSGTVVLGVNLALYAFAITRAARRRRMIQRTGVPSRPLRGDHHAPRHPDRRHRRPRATATRRCHRG